jgi:predicted Zn-dependent protease
MTTILAIFFSILAFFSNIFESVQNKIYIPCGEPLTFTISEIDKNFNLSGEEAKKIAIEAAELWNKTTGKNLLKYSEDGKIKISFVYDKRQQETIKKNILQEKIKNQKNLLDQQSLSINDQDKKFVQMKANYESSLKTFEVKLENYNAKVDAINKSGGADSYTAVELEKEKNDLQLESKSLENSRNELNNYMQNLNNQVNVYNSKIAAVNQSVNVLNKNAGQEFEEGYIEGDNIKLFQYDNISDLKRLLAHELGHSLGFEHVNNKDSIMYYLNLGNKFVLTQDDLAEYKKVCKIDTN